MRKKYIWVISCMIICLGTAKSSGMDLEKAKQVLVGELYSEIKQMFFPQLYWCDISNKALLVQDVEKLWLPTIVSYSTSAAYESVTEYENLGQDSSQSEECEDIAGMEVVKQEETSVSVSGEVLQTESEEEHTESVAEMTDISGSKKKVTINRSKLQDFDYLRQKFYQVDNTTTIDSDLLNADKLLGMDMTLSKKKGEPQVLIYHTHSQEAYADSKAGDEATSVVALGDYLEKLLEEQYGIEVLHHKGEYDVPDRDNAYAQARPHLEELLKENPSIEVVIDLHRDGVSESTRLVTEIDGKQTAQIMFFNGLSHTTAQGELEYLKNPYIESNLAFSLQMQLAAAEYYPGLTRRIYLKGYRYNMHLCPKSLLVEVGAQTNTYAEAKNAMEPLADILAMVLLGTE